MVENRLLTCCLPEVDCAKKKDNKVSRFDDNEFPSWMADKIHISCMEMTRKDKPKRAICHRTTRLTEEVMQGMFGLFKMQGAKATDIMDSVTKNPFNDVVTRLEVDDICHKVLDEMFQNKPTDAALKDYLNQRWMTWYGEVSKAIKSYADLDAEREEERKEEGLDEDEEEDNEDDDESGFKEVDF